MLSRPAARALGIKHFENEKRIWQFKVISFLKTKGFEKSDFSDLPVPLCQLLAEAYNDSQITSDYLSLTWEEYEKDPEISELRRLRELEDSSQLPAKVSKNKRKRMNKKKRAKENHEPDVDAGPEDTISLPEHVEAETAQQSNLPDVALVVSSIGQEPALDFPTASEKDSSQFQSDNLEDETSDNHLNQPICTHNLADLQPYSHINQTEPTLTDVNQWDSSTAPNKAVSKKRKKKSKGLKQKDAEMSENNHLSPKGAYKSLDITETAEDANSKHWKDNSDGQKQKIKIPGSERLDRGIGPDHTYTPPSFIQSVQQHTSLALITSPTVGKRSPLPHPETLTFNKQKGPHIFAKGSKQPASTGLCPSVGQKHQSPPRSLPSSSNSSSTPTGVQNRTVAGKSISITPNPNSITSSNSATSFAKHSTTGTGQILDHVNITSTLEFPALGSTNSSSSQLSATSRPTLTLAIQENRSNPRQASGQHYKSSNTAIPSLKVRLQQDSVNKISLSDNVNVTDAGPPVNKKQRHRVSKANHESTFPSGATSIVSQEGNVNIECTETYQSLSTTTRSDQDNYNTAISPNIDAKKQQVDNISFQNKSSQNLPGSSTLTLDYSEPNYLPKPSDSRASTIETSSELAKAHYLSTISFTMPEEFDSIDFEAEAMEAGGSSPFPSSRANMSEQHHSDESRQTSNKQQAMHTSENIKPTTEVQSVIDYARAIRRSSIETIRRGTERRMTSSSLPLATRSPLSSVSSANSAGATNMTVTPHVSTLSKSFLSDSIKNRPNTTKETTTNPLSRRLVAIPKITFSKSSQKFNNETFIQNTPKARSESVFKPQDVRSMEDKTQKSIKTSSNKDQIQAQSRRISTSMLRASAPSFIPQRQIFEPPSLITSTISSPLWGGYSSVSMSVSTSNTTDHVTSHGILMTRSGSHEAPIRGEGLTVDLKLQMPPSSLKDAQMYYPPQQSINDTRNKLWNRTRSISMSRLPSSTIDSFDDSTFKLSRSFYRQLSMEGRSWVEEYMVEMWPKFVDYDVFGNRSWIYREIYEFPEFIITTSGHVENQYRATPWETQWRPIVSHAHNLPMDVPAILMLTNSGCETPTAQFDCENNVWRIFPPSQYFGVDLRMDPEHPDYLPADKLKQWQGLEVWDYRVYRSSHMIYECHRKDCPNMVRDGNRQTMLCLGCGPLSRVRWCSRWCMFEDVKHHWKECGASEFFPPSNVYLDPELSFPSSFNKYIPMIQDVNGWNSMERHRINLTTYFIGGGYGIYPLDSMQFFHIVAPKGLCDRLSRLLNCALLDRTLRPIISYMYLLLRDLLDEQAQLEYGEYSTVLKFQIMHEWKFDWKLPDGLELLEKIKACDCMWEGTENSPKCKDGCVAGPGLGEEYRKKGLESLVRKLEEKHWILRVWRFNHPYIPDFRERLVGKGFHGVQPWKFKNLLPVRGAGWDGHISKDRRVGSWRKRLVRDAPAPALQMSQGLPMQTRESILWVEPQS